MEKQYLNKERSELAKKALLVCDYKRIATETGFAESHVVEVVRGNRKTTDTVINYITNLTQKRLKEALKTMQDDNSN